MKLKLVSFIIIGILVSACSGENTASEPETAVTEQIAEVKAQALEACNAQLEGISEEMRKQVTEVCTCTVEKMDYAKLEELTAAGEEQEAMKLSMDVAKKCSESP